MRKHDKHPGFTLMELMVVAAIIVILTMIGISTFDSVRKTSRDNQRKADLKALQVSLETFYSRIGRYPNESAASECDASNGLSATCSAGGTDWAATSDMRKVATSTTLTKIPVDPVNDATHFYLFEIDKATEGTPACAKPCRFILQTLLEKEDCIYTLKGGYGNPQDIDLSSNDCKGNVNPWPTKPCCAQ